MTKGEHNTSLGEYIKARRLSQNLTIRDCAEHSGFHGSYWRKLEAGHYDAPAAKHLQVIAHTVTCPLEDLYSLCGYTIPAELPSFAPYLRATTKLTSEDIAVMERILDSLGDEDDVGVDRRAA